MNIEQIPSPSTTISSPRTTRETSIPTESQRIENYHIIQQNNTSHLIDEINQIEMLVRNQKKLKT